MDKLSELSKPVAWVLGTPSCKHLTTDAEYADWYLKHESTASPLYSQEYVSALDKAAQFWIGESAGWKQRAEDAEKRIAELELDELAMRASSRAVHEAQENHINQQQDIIESLEKKNVDLGRALGAAEKRLAAPVRLPDPSQDKWLQWSGDYNFRSVAYFSAVKKAVRAAGFTFTVEGDE